MTATELGQEAGIPGPEQADVGDVEEEHGDAFDAETKGPADAVGDVGVDQEVLFDDSAAEDFEPVALPEDFEFPGWAGEGEVGFDPADFEGVRFLVDGVGVVVLGCLCWWFSLGVVVVGGGCFAGFGEYLDDHLF